MAFTEEERRFMLNANGQVRHLEDAIKEEVTLVERISELNLRLSGIRENITRIEAALRTGISDLKVGGPGGPP